MQMFFFKSTTDELLLARYRSLLGDVPVAIFTALSAAAIQMIVLKDEIDWKFSVLMPSFRMLIGVALLMYWLWYRKDKPNVHTIRQRLEVASLIMVVAGAMTFIRSLYLFNLADEFGRYFLIFHTTIYGFCFAFILSKIGLAAYVYNLILISCAIVCVFLGNLQHAYPVTTLILIFEAGMLLAMRTSNQVFDQLVHATHETNMLLEENRQLANQDALTHLPNRRHFFMNVEAQLEHARLRDTQFAVGVLDLDDFKPVNDQYGHHVGDQVLVEVGNRLSRFRPAEIQFYRIGGDEFAFLLLSEENDAALKQLGKELIEVIATPMVIEQLTICISASIGACWYSEAKKTSKVLYECADHALYQVKTQGRANIDIHSGPCLQQRDALRPQQAQAAEPVSA